MADKSAFVPVDAIGNHKNTDLDVDIGRQVVRNEAAKPARKVPVQEVIHLSENLC
ncbi:Transposase [Caenorhabditis elegans]|uniref:Transposase n=1 Tax=Caenorhabditis elegans TaxID=6239 RepID=Q56VY2_CAEEL|nr:Transposase [Caenorhabditis elegans]pir/T31571/ hypothetical protein Y105C5A.n - Caenorhabditis elegans [Caenorhabditis elegans]CAB54994.1 Transposase [Caenorhabditis elegans]|eukprot:NP_001023428.1 Uncharacterized protein CELE_Y105C5A.26 [Caenorhabditis elegans]